MYHRRMLPFEQGETNLDQSLHGTTPESVQDQASQHPSAEGHSPSRLEMLQSGRLRGRLHRCAQPEGRMVLHLSQTVRLGRLPAPTPGHITPRPTTVDVRRPTPLPVHAMQRWFLRRKRPHGTRG
uniref:(northern house mosquito) hypothetical protein n=1 Tax=Culex pipiens TaxID=7175 RepID=A0A8D8BL31_CULPI